MDFSDDVRRGGVWSCLSSPAAFAGARIGRNGRVLEWPDPTGASGEPVIDVDADALFFLGVEQKALPAIREVMQSISGAGAS